MPKPLRGILIAAAFLSCPSVDPALATKCPFALYEVEGQIQLPEGEDPAEVRVLLFLEGTTRPSDYPPEEGEADWVSPDSNGRFTISSYLSTASDHGCKRIEDRGSLIITGQRGIQSRRVEVVFPDRRLLRKELSGTADVGLVKLAGTP